MTKTTTTIYISICYILGTIAYFNNQVAIVASILFMTTAILLVKDVISNKVAIASYLIFLLAIANCTLQIKTNDDISKLAPAECTLTARVVSIPTTNSTVKTKFYADVNNIGFENTNQKINSKTLITIYDKKTNTKQIEIGDTIVIKGHLTLPKKATNPSQFDYAKYLTNFDTFTLFYAESTDWKIEKKAEGGYWKFLQEINRTRDSIIKKHAANIKSPNIELLGGIVFGDDAINPPDEIKKSFINSGLLHILAASGMNVTLIFGLWFFISQKVKMHYRLSIFTGIILILFYTCMTGFGPSILRASLMLIFILIGKLIDREAHTISLLFFVALLLLLHDPAMINNIGFQLSFAVTFGLLLTCPILFEKIENKYLNIIASACFVPLIAQLYAAPIQMFYFNTFATYSVFANIAIIPFLTVVSFLGFLTSIIAMIPIICTYFCKISDFVLNPFLSALINISDFFSSLPNSIIQTPHPSITQLILYFLLLLNLTFVLKKPKDNKHSYLSLIILFALLIVFSLPLKNQNCEIIFFDMGNADSSLIKTPENKYILIDTGKAPYKNSQAPAEQIILKYFKDHAIDQLDLLILTHFDSDHTGGTISILKNIKVKKVILNQHSDSSRLSKEIMDYIKTNNIKSEAIKENKELIVERDFKLKNIKNETSKKLEENETSIINLIECKGYKVLFMGDSGIEAYKSIDKKDLKNIDIFKVGHHGGKNVINKEMLSELNPKTAIISTGKNQYGHPRKETINLLKENKVKTLRTDYNNAIKVIITDKNIGVLTFKTDLRRFTKTVQYKNN